VKQEHTNSNENVLLCCSSIHTQERCPSYINIELRMRNFREQALEALLTELRPKLLLPTFTAPANVGMEHWVPTPIGVLLPLLVLDGANDPPMPPAGVLHSLFVCPAPAPAPATSSAFAAATRIRDCHPTPISHWLLFIEMLRVCTYNSP
jgi:hypothetical protein